MTTASPETLHDDSVAVAALEQAVTERRCIVTLSHAEKDNLLRFVVSPDGIVVPDLSAKLPGRGLYVTPNRATLEHAIRKNVFSRAAKRAVTIPPDLLSMLETLHRKQIFGLLGLARRAGCVSIGTDTVTRTLRSGKAGLVFLASDASDATARDIIRLAATSPGNPPAVVTNFDAATLGNALGHGGILVTLAVQAGKYAQQVQKTVFRLDALGEKKP